LGATTAQAADTRTPDILSSVSSNSVQSMSEDEVLNTRGEYLTCYFDTSKKYYVNCKPSISHHTKTTGWLTNGYRWHLFDMRKYAFWGSKHYWHVSR
jgi:hypothetical protein